MNSRSNEARLNEAWADDARFDRLVDGELSPDEYRQLLTSLDDEPGGWRRCALAFLEAQALRSAMGSILVQSERDGMTQQSVEPQTLQSKVHPQSSWLSLALMVLVAFGLGGMVSLSMLRLQNQGGTETQIAVPHGSNGNVAGESLVETKAPSKMPRDPRNMTLVVDVPSIGQRQVEIPVYDPRQTSPDEVWQQNPLFSEDLVRALRSRGHDVMRSRSLLPVPLDDGRNVVVPMEEIQITPVGRRVF